MRIIILMIYAALGYAIYVFVRGYFSSGDSSAESASNKMVECEECGAMVPLTLSKNSIKSGETVYFCSDDCIAKHGDS